MLHLSLNALYSLIGNNGSAQRSTAIPEVDAKALRSLGY